MPELLLGPLVRFVSDTEATLWMETSEPCEVEVRRGDAGPRWRKASARTFTVCGHHYGLVVLSGLKPGSEHSYEVWLDGGSVWPPTEGPIAGFPASRIRTMADDERHRIVFGSCRVAAPHEDPWILPAEEDKNGLEIDALRALALRMRDEDPERWPHLLMLLGDQVYVEQGSPRTREKIRAKRDTSEPPGDGVIDFEEYSWLYHESWGDPVIRWLLSTVSSAMMFDDHDVHDDWNISLSWLEEMRATDWWYDRMTSALSSYWVHQHLGNLSPSELAGDKLFARVKEADDAGELLHDWAEKVDHGSEGSRWSFARDIGKTRLIVFDSREGRVLEERLMCDEAEWEWVEEHCTGDFNHLLLAHTLPLLMPRAFHYAEAWSEAVCAGAWGSVGQKVGEKLRRGMDLEHWPAFHRSFERMVELMTEVASGKRGEPPATIVSLAGDIHHAYLMEVAYHRDAGAKSATYQAVCSPFRNPLSRNERLAALAGNRKPVQAFTRLIARAAGVKDPAIRWRMVEDPTFDNQFATLELDGRDAQMRIEKVLPGDPDAPEIEVSLERRLA